jgi:hypothetical protein
MIKQNGICLGKMKHIISFLVFLFTINGWCQYEELNNAQGLSIDNSKMIDLVNLNQNLLHKSEMINLKLKSKILENTRFLDSLCLISIKVVDSIKIQIMQYPAMLTSESEKRRVIRHHKKIKNSLYKFNKTTIIIVAQLKKKGEEFKKKTLLFLHKKQARYLMQLKKQTNSLEELYEYSLKDSRAY